ncbi:MAG: hypothetical protein JSU00_14415 [Acidobacteria bacterium]|nr:hypothetical protein [Acidobacteriota bacterium]
MKFVGTLLVLIALVGCSDAPKSAPAAEEKKAAPKALEPLTGRQAYQQMYVSARAWAPDAQPLQLKSLQLQEVKAAPGKAGAWQCTFVSPGRGRAKVYTWSAEESTGNLHKGVFAGQEDSYSPNRQMLPYLTAAIKADSDEAYQEAMKKSKEFEKKLEGVPVNFTLEQTPRFPSLVWRVFWGESVSSSTYTVFVNATTGQFLERVR